MIPLRLPIYFRLVNAPIGKTVWGNIDTRFCKELSDFHDKSLLDKLTDFHIIACFVPDSSLSEIIQAQKLDKGETDAILLAKIKNADLLIIDELNGRKVAIGLNLRIIGILGIIRDAKLEGLIQAIKPLLDDLRLKTTFRFSDILYEKLLLDAGEK